MTIQNKAVYIKTFGCQMNMYDSNRMADLLAPEGYREVKDVNLADMIILNTCHIREKAAEKVYSELGRIRQIKASRKEKGKGTIIAVAGCVAQAEGEEILRRAPVVDIVVGPQSYHRLPKLLSQVELERRRLVDTDFNEADKFQSLNIALDKASLGDKTTASQQKTPRRAPSAFLTVQEGCDKFCTFCVVPYTRGVEYSRPVDDILIEAEKLVAQGVKEITLLGQNVNAYHGTGPEQKSWSLAQLLCKLSEINELERLRYTTSHPRDMTGDLIAAHRDNPKLMPYLHLPFQAGSDRILKAMNRKHGKAFYLELIDKIRAAQPDLALSTDIIVGFPGETDEDFAETLEVVEKVKFAQAYSFKYSSRPGTPAADMDIQVSEQVKSQRLQKLQSVLNKQQLAFNTSCVGQTMPVLFDKRGREDGQLIGRSPYLQAVHAHLDARYLGHIVHVTISEAGPNSLRAVISMTDNPASINNKDFLDDRRLYA